LATEQQAASDREIRALKSELDEVKKTIANDPKISRNEDIRGAVTNLEVLVARVITANNATTTTLTFPAGVPAPAHLTPFTDNRWLEQPKSTTHTERKE